MDIADLLQASGRRWYRQPGASDADLERLVSAAGLPLPRLLVELLRFSNGGEGPLALAPRVFCLSDAEFIADGLRDDAARKFYPGLLFFGSNGGLERIALDTRGASPPWPVVMMDPVAGNDSAVPIAIDFEEFMSAVGRDFTDSA